MTQEAKNTYRQHVKQNIEKCVELVGSIKELSKATGFSVKAIQYWTECSTGIKYEHLMHIINTTSELERDRIERINNIEVNL